MAWAGLDQAWTRRIWPGRAARRSWLVPVWPEEEGGGKRKRKKKRGGKEREERERKEGERGREKLFGFCRVSNPVYKVFSIFREIFR